MSESNESPQNQSTGKFLVSREGRPVLLGTLGAIVVFGAIGVYTWGLLFPSNDAGRPAQTQEQRDATRQQAGSTDVDASSENLTPSLTSQTLTPEAREAINAYNETAEREGRIPVPTPDDVEMVRVEPSLPDGNGATAPEASPEQRQTQRVDRRAQADLQRQVDEQNRVLAEIHNEFRTRRFEAANALAGLYSQAPMSASMAFETSEDGRRRNSGGPLRVERNNDGTAGVRDENGNSSGTCESPLVKGGEIVYAKTDIALNTDYQGPVRMTFLSGKISGYIGMGSFELNELGAMMKLKIETIIDPDGQTYSVSSWVLDPQTTLWAMASNVDRHIIYRYGGFGLGAVLSSFAALAENRSQQSEIVTPDGTRSTTNRDPDGKQVTWTVLGELGGLFEDVFRSAINRPITVTLDPEEEAGVLFENTVCEINSEITRDRNDRERRAAQGLMDPLS
jgi:hypothetical protein